MNPLKELKELKEKITIIDFETFYNDQIDAKKLGYRKYAERLMDLGNNDGIYLMAVRTNKGYQWVGNPVDFTDWEQIHDSTHFIAHNAKFEQAMIEELRKHYPLFHLININKLRDTMDMCAYIGLPKSLKDAVMADMGLELSKAVREDMKGRFYSKLTPQQQQDVRNYALQDVAFTERLYVEHHEKMAEWDVSFMNRQSSLRGVRIDMETLKREYQKIAKTIWLMEQELPWVDEGEEAGSVKGLARHCYLHGITPPKSTANDEDLDGWLSYTLQRTEKGQSFIRALLTHRKLTHIKNIYANWIDQAIGDEVPADLFYMGASATGRFSGRIQGLPKNPTYVDNDGYLSVDNLGDCYDVRKKIIPRAGKKIIKADFAQMEPRIIAWVVKLPIPDGLDIYTAYARRNLGYAGVDLKKDDEALYRLAKLSLISLSYGVGASKFRDICLNAGLDLGVGENYIKVVADFRSGNKEITGFWSKLEQALHTHKKGSLSCRLPSGRNIYYFNIQKDANGFTASPTLNGTPKGVYGALMFENWIQAIGRDILIDKMRALKAVGIDILYTVHDEVVLEVEKTYDNSLIKAILEAPYRGEISLKVELTEIV